MLDASGTNVSQAILHGSALTSGGPASRMPAFGDGYSDAEIAALTNFVVQRFGAVQGHVTATDVADRRKQP